MVLSPVSLSIALGVFTLCSVSSDLAEDTTSPLLLDEGVADEFPLEEFSGVVEDFDILAEGRASLLDRLQVDVQLDVLFVVCHYFVLQSALRD